MYITIEKIKGEKTIFLNSSIVGNNEIAITSFFSDNTKHEVHRPITLFLPKNKQEVIRAGTYTARQINSFLIADVEFNAGKDIEISNKLKDITELKFYLNEIDNNDSLIDGLYSNILFNYDVVDYDLMTKCEVFNREYIKLRNNINSFTIRITDQDGATIKDDLGISVRLHVREKIGNI